LVHGSQAGPGKRGAGAGVRVVAGSGVDVKGGGSRRTGKREQERNRAERVHARRRWT